MRCLALAFAVIVITVTAALSQTPSPARDTEGSPPSPSGSHDDLHRPHGPSFEIERSSANGTRIVVHCAETETTKNCLEAAAPLVDKALAPAK